jgi:hypothetical protein
MALSLSHVFRIDARLSDPDQAIDLAATIQIAAPLQKHHMRELSARLAELILSNRTSYGRIPAGYLTRLLGRIARG